MNEWIGDPVDAVGTAHDEVGSQKLFDDGLDLVDAVANKVEPPSSPRTFVPTIISAVSRHAAR